MTLEVPFVVSAASTPSNAETRMAPTNIGRDQDLTQSIVKNWTLVFKANLDLKALDADQTVPQYIKDTLKKMDDYSIHQLLVDLTNADISNFLEKESFIDLPTSLLKVTFGAYVDDYIKNLRKPETRDHSIIHYLPSSKKPDTYAIPTLPPTDLNFQDLLFLATDSNTGEKEDNMLIYLQMTGNVPLPPDILKTSANWVVPAPPGQVEYDGTVALSKKIFLDGWLLPKLAPLNRATSFVVDGVEMSAWPIDHCSKMAFHAGFKDGEEPTKGPWIYDPSASSDTVNVYNYSYRSHDGEELRPWAYASMTHETNNTLKIPVGLNQNGKCIIEISGKTVTGADIKTALNHYNKARTASWSVEITMDGVDHGKLKIATNYTHKFEGDSSADEQAYPGDYEGLKGASAKIQDVLTKLSTGSTEKDMKEALEGSWAFVFAGAADFLFSEAAFN
ncbi:hypothetical protein H0H81_009731, partial [Sphagnurus paluster]